MIFVLGFICGITVALGYVIYFLYKLLYGKEN